MHRLCLISAPKFPQIWVKEKGEKIKNSPQAVNHQLLYCSLMANHAVSIASRETNCEAINNSPNGHSATHQFHLAILCLRTV